MSLNRQHQEKSRLGRLLIERGLISSQQLEAALAAQRQSGERLGEILVTQGWVEARHLNRALRQQKRLRLAAAFLAVVAAPLQPAMAQVASPAAGNVTLKTAGIGSMHALDEAEMAGIDAQSADMDFSQLAAVLGDSYTTHSDSELQHEGESDEAQAGIDGLKLAGTLSRSVFPLGNFIDAEVEIVGVQYDPDRIKPLLTEDGRGFNVNMPARIERLSFIDMRPKGSIGGPTMGSIHLEGIEFNENFSMVVRPQ